VRCTGAATNYSIHNSIDQLVNQMVGYTGRWTLEFMNLGRYRSQPGVAWLPFSLVEALMIDERLTSRSTGVTVFGGTGNKYDVGPCGISDGTFGNASNMSRSNVFDDGEIDEIERSGPGDSGVMGGSIGDCSGIESSWECIVRFSSCKM
jgi:hypothetical protein